MKITFLGAGSTVFARAVIGDCMCVEALRDSEFALYDIDSERLEQSHIILEGIRKEKGCYGKITCFAGEENRRKALANADFVIKSCKFSLCSFQESALLTIINSLFPLLSYVA